MPRFLVAAALVLAACGGAQAPAGQPVPTGSATAVLQVENMTFVDLSMYVLLDNRRERLGRATANTTTKFPIPPAMVGSGRELQFITDPVGPRREAVSRRVQVAPGDTVFFRIGPF